MLTNNFSNGIGKKTLLKEAKSMPSRYVFEATHHPEYSNVYSVELLRNFPRKFNRIAPAILRTASWDNLEMNCNGPKISIYPVVEDGNCLSPEIVFHHSIGSRLFGHDVETEKAVYGSLIGPEDENGIVVPALVELMVSRVKFDNIKFCQYPEFDFAENWDNALKAKLEAHPL